MRFICPICDEGVDVRLYPADGETVSVIDVFCATRHPKPVTMESEPDETPRCTKCETDLRKVTGVSYAEIQCRECGTWNPRSS